MYERIQTRVDPAKKSSFAPARSGLSQRKCACGGTPGSDGECAECRAKRLSGSRRRPPEDPGARSGPSETPAVVQEVLASSDRPLDAAVRADTGAAGLTEISPSQSGRPLDPTTRTRMEARFRHDFGHVRVYTDAASAGAAARLNARAFTLDRDIHFGAPYEPSDLAGESLLAHELTHVVQADAAVSSPARPASSIDALEHEARRAATAFRHGAEVPPLRGVARGLAAPLRQQPGDDPGAPTFGWLQSDPETGRVAPPRIVDRVELREIKGRWYEIRVGQTDKPMAALATGQYNFVVQDGRTWASRYSHGSASGGGRVQYAGQIQFGAPGSLSFWNPASGSYKPAETFATQAGLPADRFQPLPTGLEKKKVQLPVIQQGTRKDAPPAAPPPQAAPKPSPVPPAGGGGARVTPSTPTASINKQVASVIASSTSSVARAQRFTRRIQGYLAAWGALNAALNILSTIDTVGKLLAHGTALPEEQRNADKVLQNSQEAQTEAEDAVEDISLLGWTFIIGEALRNEDDQALFALDEAMMKLRHPLEESEKTLKGMADDLFRQTNALQVEKLKQLVEIATPHTTGTGSNAVAFAFYQSLERIHGTLLTAARNYSTASETPAYWAYQLKQLEDSANDAAWYVARKRAAQRLQQQQQIEAAKQFRSEAPVVETEKERQAREFMERLRDPNTLRGGKTAE